MRLSIYSLLNSSGEVSGKSGSDHLKVSEERKGNKLELHIAPCLTLCLERGFRKSEKTQKSLANNRLKAEALAVQ